MYLWIDMAVIFRGRPFEDYYGCNFYMFDRGTAYFGLDHLMIQLH